MRIPLRGTLLNVGLVVLGSVVGLTLGAGLLGDYRGVALSALGLVTLAMGLQMFLKHQNVLVVAGAVSIGAVLGSVIGLQGGLVKLGESLQQVSGGGGTFVEGFVGASVLFCVGPMTLMGCIQDGVEGRSEWLDLKSVLDGVASVFLAATLGVGVLFSAVSVLVVQGLLTLFGRRLQGLRDDAWVLGDLTGAGGIMMIGIGLGLLQIKSLPMANFLPALALVPMMIGGSRWFAARRSSPVSA
jgi:hypothetical protein